MKTKKILFIVRQPDAVTAREVLDAALVAAAFDQRVAILFREQGVRHLVSGPHNERSVMEEMGDFHDYGIQVLSACSRSLSEYGIDTGTVTAREIVLLDAERQSQLIREQDAVIVD